MKEIKILGEEIKINFCMAVEIAYEEITGEPFDVTTLKSMKNTVALGMAAILTANPDTGITIDRLLREASGKEIGDLNRAVIESMSEWLSIPKVIADEEAKEPKPDVNDPNAPKN